MAYVIAKATLTLTTAYSAAPASSVTQESWGAITLWDIRPWLPWSSRGLIGPTAWEGYLQHGTSVFDSSQAPGYNATNQGPKSWAKRTDAVVIYDSTGTVAGTYPYTPCSSYGSGPYVYTPGSITSGAAFADTNLASLLSTLVVAIYAWNSYPPLYGGPTTTDNLSFYGCYVDVVLTGGGTGRYYPDTTVVIAPGPSVATPTGAVVQETNAAWNGFSALWHPAVLLLTNWAGTVVWPPPPKNHAFVNSVMATGKGKNASFTGGW